MDAAARDRARARRRGHHRRPRDALRRDDADHPPRPEALRGSRLSPLRRPDRATTAGRAGTINGQAFKGLSAGLTLSELCALYFSRALVESLAGHAVSRRRRERVRQARGGADGAHAAVPRSTAARDRDQAGSGAAGATPERQRSRRARAGSHAAPAAVDAHLSLGLERPNEAVSRPSLPARLRAGRSLPARVRAGIRRGADVRRRADRRASRCSKSVSRRSTNCPTRRFQHSLGVHSGPPEHIEIEFDAPVADYVRAREWHPSQAIAEAADGGVRAVARRLHRPRASELDSQLRAIRAGARAGSACARHRGAVRGSEGEIWMKLEQRQV